MADMGQKRSFKSVGHKNLLTISVNKSILLGSKIGQIKYKSVGMRDFLRFFARNCSLDLEYFLK